MLNHIDRKLLFTVITLMGFGLVQVYSASYIYATEYTGDSLFYFKKQLLFLLLSALVLIISMYIPIRLYEKSVWLLWSLTILLLIATLIPGIGHRAGGASRWIAVIPGIAFEPSELLKITFVMALAALFVNFAKYSKVQLSTRVILIFAPLIVLLKQPDFGTFTICMFVFITLIFVFGLPWRYFLPTVITALIIVVTLIASAPYRRARILAYLDPWADPKQLGFQSIQSMLSLHAGGVSGVGLGQGQGKLFFLPEAHTDFTLAVLGEETGFIGTLIVLALYGFIVLRGIQVTLRADRLFVKVVALGITVTFALSVLINIGVVVGLLPTKGLALPFLSYGGSALLMTCLGMGILLSANRAKAKTFLH